jgi:hypothetical protein
VPVAILRQLAKTERSPAAPVEDQHQRSVCDQRRKAARRLGTVRQREVRGGIPSPWDAGVVHEMASLSIIREVSGLPENRRKRDCALTPLRPSGSERDSGDSS